VRPTRPHALSWPVPAAATRHGRGTRMRTLAHHGFGVAWLEGNERRLAVVRPDQIARWRNELAEEPSSFARDVASILLTELERGQLEAAECYQRFSSMQAGIIRAQLSVAPPLCPACRDEALRRTAERMRLPGTMLPEATPGIPFPKVTPRRRS
jgi:hypothetical protein